MRASKDFGLVDNHEMDQILAHAISRQSSSSSTSNTNYSIFHIWRQSNQSRQCIKKINLDLDHVSNEAIKWDAKRDSNNGHSLVSET